MKRAPLVMRMRTRSVLGVTLAIYATVMVGLVLVPERLGISDPFEWLLTFAAMTGLSTLTTLVLLMTRRIP
ncbi:MAG: hypothetical protein AAFU49_24190 [Pseudomonadota bacterium]